MIYVVFTILGYPCFITHKVDWYSTVTWPDGELNRMGIVQGRSEYERKMDNQYRRNNIIGSLLSARPNQCNLQWWKLIVANHIVAIENSCVFYTRYSKTFIQRSGTKQDLSMKGEWITSIDKKKQHHWVIIVSKPKQNNLQWQKINQCNPQCDNWKPKHFLYQTFKTFYSKI